MAKEFILVEYYNDPTEVVVIGLFSTDAKADKAIAESIAELKEHWADCSISDYGKVTLTVNNRIFL